MGRVSDRFDDATQETIAARRRRLDGQAVNFILCPRRFYDMPCRQRN